MDAKRKKMNKINVNWRVLSTRCILVFIVILYQKENTPLILLLLWLRFVLIYYVICIVVYNVYIYRIYCNVVGQCAHRISRIDLFAQYLHRVIRQVWHQFSENLRYTATYTLSLANWISLFVCFLRFLLLLFCLMTIGQRIESMTNSHNTSLFSNLHLFITQILNNFGF